MYTLDIRPSLDKKLAKLAKRDKKQLDIIFKKAGEVIQNPQHYKNLKAPLQHWKRVHIVGPFVLTFSVDEQKKIVILEDYDHHDNIYGN